MSTSFGVTEKMDLETLAHVVELRQRDGLHIDYQYGIKLAGSSDWKFEFPEPRYTGVSIRMFLYHRQLSHAKLLMEIRGYEDRHFVSIQINNGDVNLSYRGLYKSSATTNPTGQIPTNKFVSLGIRLDRQRLLHALVDRYVHPAYDMIAQVLLEPLIIRMYTSDNYLVSLHVCDEVGGSFPPKGLGQIYTLRDLFLPIGSYVTVFAVFQGGTPDGKTITISFPYDGADSAVTHKDAPLNVNDEFRITVRNSTEGWLVTTSFLGDTQSAAVVSRKDSNNEKFTNVAVSPNCFIKRILAVCGVVPIQYRRA